MTGRVLLALLLAFGPALACVPAAQAQHAGRDLYDRLLAGPAAAPLSERVTGVVVPHHAPALGLASLAFALASGREIDRVIILCPDHYRRSQTPFATTDRDFNTPYGPTPVDRAAVSALIRSPLAGLSDLFDNEHGVTILLPLVAAYFPKAAVVPLAARITATPAECEELADILRPLVTPGTLVVLSADFSHHQSREDAKRFDQQSLNALAQNDPVAVRTLRQPENVDTVAMLLVQSILQKRLGSHFQALADQDTSEVTARPVAEATSYICGLWGVSGPVPAMGRKVVFAGDTFFGRAMGSALADPAKRDWLARRVAELTGGAEMAVNLEGMLADSCPRSSTGLELCMEAAPSIDLLRRMNVRWAGLANNHAMDLGPAGYGRMKELLRGAGIAALEKNTVTDLGPMRLAAFTALENNRSRAETAIGAKELAVLDGPAAEAGKPLAVLVHWGREWVSEPDGAQLHLYDAFRAKGAGLVIGAHSHRPGAFECGDGGCLASSLGNFVFDQTRPEAGGILLEVTVFPRGTWFARPIPAGNLGAELLKGGAGPARPGPNAP